MQIERRAIVRLLKEDGRPDRAEAAERDLPERLDHERDAALLEAYGLDPQSVLLRFTRGRGTLGM